MERPPIFPVIAWLRIVLWEAHERSGAAWEVYNDHGLDKATANGFAHNQRGRQCDNLDPLVAAFEAVTGRTSASLWREAIERALADPTGKGLKLVRIKQELARESNRGFQRRAETLS